jgi:hypothetical protein
MFRDIIETKVTGDSGRIRIPRSAEFLEPRPREAC